MIGENGVHAQAVKKESIKHSKVSHFNCFFSYNQLLCYNIGREMRITKEGNGGNACPSDREDWRTCDIPICTRNSNTLDCGYEWEPWS